MFESKRFYREFPGEVLPVRPFGLFISVSTVSVAPPIEGAGDEFTQNPSDQYHYEGFIEGRVAGGFWARTPVSFSLPKPDKDGFFRVGATLFCFTNVGFVSPWNPLKDGEYHFLDKSKVALRVLEGMFGSKGVMVPGGDKDKNNYSPLANFFFQSRPNKIVHVNNDQLQAVLLSRLVTHPFVRQVQQTKVQIEGSKNLVLLHHRRDGIKIDPLKFPQSLIGKLDMCSTSASGTINSVYQLCHGARIKDGKIESSNLSDFCEFTRRNTAFLQLSPGRAYLARAAVMNSCELTHPEPRPIEAEGSVVQTRNLLTAIMDLGFATFEDMIAMSESCANMMEAQSVTRITRWTPEPLCHLKVQRGDLVKPFGVLATRLERVISEANVEIPDEGMKETDDEDSSVEDKGKKPKKISLVASELKEEAVLEDIQITPAWYAGVLGVRTTFVFRSFLPMRTGDKITCFSGCKGVVQILPDSEMPMIDNKVVDICVSPKSIFKRGTIGMLLEAVIGREYENGKFEKTIAFGDEYVKDFQWAAMYHRTKSPVVYKGEELPERAFWGYVPWMRIVKSGISSRRASAVGTDRPLTGEGLLPDTASTAGQSLDPSKSIVMVSRGMVNTLRALLGDTPAGMQVMVETVAAIDGPAVS